jgi:hypothetical protein
MPLCEPIAFNRRFVEQMAEIRAKIETLAPENRSIFADLADRAEQQHRSMQNDCAKMRALTDDMRLNEAAVKFEVWAATENIRRTLSKSGVLAASERGVH